MKLRFWGTRGNIATPGLRTVALGGNTACIEVQSNSGGSILLDSGTGIIAHATALAANLKGTAPEHTPTTEHHLVISHFHWDHIIGFPFFHPIHSSDTVIHIYSAFPCDMLENHVRALFDGTYSPLRDLDNVPARVTFNQIPLPAPAPTEEADSPEIDIGGFRVSALPADHIEPNFALRLRADDQTLVYATDHEARSGPLNEGLIRFSKQADWLLHDAQYTAEEYSRHVGWGHSSIEAAIANGRLADVKHLLLCHHHPRHGDDFLRAYLDRLRRRGEASGPQQITLAEQGDWVL
jgi:ribonuclease BN (tRNA processing enzyme)